MAWSDDMRCLYCDGKLPAYRKIANGQFCSAAHGRAYWKKQEELAVDRLKQEQPLLTPEPESSIAESAATLTEKAPVEKAPGTQAHLASAESATNVTSIRQLSAQEQAPQVDSELASDRSERDVLKNDVERSVPLVQGFLPIAAETRPSPLGASVPIGASAANPRAEAVDPLHPDSLEVLLPVVQLRPDVSFQDPSPARLLALPARFSGAEDDQKSRIAGNASALYPNPADPKVPGSRLAPVAMEEIPAPPRSLSAYANLVPEDPAGVRNPWQHAIDFWQHAPRDLKLALFAIPVLVGMAFHPRLPKVHVAAPAANVRVHADTNFQHVLAKPLDAVQQNLANRAAVALVEDFRSGMDDWQMHNNLSTPWSFDSNGFVRPGSLALYRPSMHLSDYDLQFVGLIDKQALSFVVRALDFENYYVVKLNVIKRDPLPEIEVTRYAVIHGIAQHRADTTVAVSALPDTIYHVELSVHDDTFLLSLQSKVADSWSEPALPQGGIGFFSASGEQSRIRWLQMTHQYDMLGRLCAFLAPYNISN